MSAVQKATTAPLLVEIGCEEIPARFLTQAQKDFGERLEGALKEARLVPFGVVTAGSEGAKSTSLAGPPRTFSTPRRLVTYVPEVLAKQLDKVEEITGPPVKMAFDAAGKPTRAAESFALKSGTNVADLIRVTTPKGEYLAFKRTTPGRSALELLSEILPSVITGLAFPKSMYWVAKSGPRFVRPIRWVVALLGEGKQARVIPFEIAGVKPGKVTYGHRALRKGPIGVGGFEEYAKKLPQAGVEIDPEARRGKLRKEVKVLLEVKHLRLIEDRELEDWIVNSTEWPTPVLGSFEERFLKLPREILITVMRDHQKYFATEDEQGELQPRFVTVLNQKGDPKGLIRAGHERVLTARFRDAEFFWDADLKRPFDTRRDLLAGVTYQAELGSYADKAQRMRAIADDLCAQLGAQKKQEWRPVDTDRALRAVELSKCDLTTHIVQEFPELQGVVGGLYAKAWGEAREVYEAIYDHYLPRGMDGRCPRTLFGAVVSLADKIDSVVAGFAAGLEPTGSSDPFGLRRAGNGIIRVLLEFRLPISLNEMLFTKFTEILRDFPGIEWEKPGHEVLPALVEFFKERLRYYLNSVRGLRYDTVRAVMAPSWDVPLDALERAEAVEAIRGSADFLALSVAAKRIKNILAKSATANDWKPGEPQEVLFKEGPERELYQAYTVILSEAKNLRCFAGAQHDNILRAFERIASLRPAVDHFFDKVLVMAEDRGLRENRLRLLGKLDELFSGIADLSQIESTTLDVVDASTSRAEKPSDLSRQPSAKASGKRSG